MGKCILILGATSTISRQIGLELVNASDSVCLAGRNHIELARIAADLNLKKSPKKIIIKSLDTSDFASHEALIISIHAELGGLDIVIAGTGELGDQIQARSAIPLIKAIIDSNFTGIASLLAVVANIMEKQKSGRIAVLSSVAGDRGRQSNYIYGSAKSGMNAYLQGLRNRLFSAGVTVTTIKLGFVDTKMVFGKGGMFLVASPEQAAKAVVKLTLAGAYSGYVPLFWCGIMFIIRSVPEFIFKRLKL